VEERCLQNEPAVKGRVPYRSHDGSIIGLPRTRKMVYAVPIRLLMEQALDMGLYLLFSG
jgi:hypothetical protein